MAVFSVIGTPIGNMGDITGRALKTLASADLVLCEDTRVTRKLLDRHGIKTPTLSYHAHSKLSRIDQIIGLLKEGRNLALVSDAGTPGISDPGAELVARIREAACSPAAFSGDDEDFRHCLKDVKIEAVPGPSALAAALSVAGMPLHDGFTFLGFLPHKKGRETLFKEIASSKRTMVFYESPHRIQKTLDSLVGHLADSGKKVAVCRELTKMFEETVISSAAECAGYFRSHPDKARGEFVVIVGGEI